MLAYLLQAILHAVAFVRVWLQSFRKGSAGNGAAASVPTGSHAHSDRYKQSIPVKERVIVVGGSFAGLAFCRTLLAKRSSARRYDVVLISQNTHVEYTPGILRTLVQPSQYQHIHASIEQCLPAGVKFIHGSVSEVHEGCVQLTRSADGQIVTLHADKIIVATGSSYAFPSKAAPNRNEPANRQRDLTAEANKLANARSVSLLQRQRLVLSNSKRVSF
jgi:hypothetical protein